MVARARDAWRAPAGKPGRPSRRRRRWAVPVGVAAAAIAIAVALPSLLPFGPRPDPAAAALLHRFAQIARKAPAEPAPGPGQLVYSKTISTQSYRFVGDGVRLPLHGPDDERALVGHRRFRPVNGHDRTTNLPHSRRQGGVRRVGCLSRCAAGGQGAVRLGDDVVLKRTRPVSSLSQTRGSPDRSRRAPLPDRGPPDRRRSAGGLGDVRARDRPHPRQLRQP